MNTKLFMLKSYSRRFLFGILFLTTSLFIGCNSQKRMPNGVNFNELKLSETKVVETFKNAKVKGKNVLVIFDAVWCSVCKEFNQKTMTDPQVVKTLKEDYEVINIDVDTFPEVTKVFGRRAGKSKIEGVPTVMIFSPEGFQQEEFAGSYDGKAFEQILKRNL